MKTVAMAAIWIVTLLAASAVWPIDYCDVDVPTVAPGKAIPGGLTAPSDAIVLFDGRDLSQWQGKGGGAALWEVRDGVLTVRKGTGDIETRQSFHDVQLHVEWRIPVEIAGEGQHRGNSGVFLMGRYEIQILDSYHNRTYADGAAGAVYGQVPPLVNAMRAPGEWNTYDIVFTAPRYYDDGKLLTSAHVTVLHNGVLIQNNAEVLGSTGAWGRPGYYEAVASGPIRLQDHPDPSAPISFRNIWVREINAPASVTPANAPKEGDGRLKIVSTRTIQELIENPAARAVLTRCVPELVPNPKVLDYIGKKTLPQLKGEADITLTDEKLSLIEAQLAEALSHSSPQSNPR